MTSQWLAQTLDDAFIRWAIRPTLPALSETSRFLRLRRAEARTETRPQDEHLFAPQAAPLMKTWRSRSLARGLTLETWQWAAPAVPIERDWAMPAHPQRALRSHTYARPNRTSLLIGVSGWVPWGGLLERALWPIERLDQAGFDTAILQLWNPSTLERRSVGGPFPNADPSRNVIELARSVGSLGQWVRSARDRGYQRVVLWGTSLGAYVAALFATLAPPADIDAIVLEKPLVRMSDPLRLHGMGPEATRQSVALRLDHVYRAVSALERQPNVDSRRMHVIGAAFDRVTPCEGAERLATHFGASFARVEASHVYDPGRQRRFLQVLGKL